MSEPRRRWRSRLGTLALTLAALVVYTGLVTYDIELWRLPVSLWRYLRLPVDPTIDRLAPTAPAGDSRALEAWVRQAIRWGRDWEVHGVPWYFPTPAEALARGRGDCEAQTIVLASLLAARGVPYRLRASFSHLWVEYPGRPPAAGELPEQALMENVGGRYRFRWPDLPELRRHWDNQVDLLWTPMPPVRKILLLVGWPLLAVAIPRRRRRQHERRAAGNENQRGAPV